MSTVLLRRRLFLHRAWRPIEKLISRVIRGWPPVTWVNPWGENSFGQRLAPCDSLIIGSAPWLCLCCLRVRRWIGGIDTGGRPEQVVTQHGTYVWPAPDPLEFALATALERMAR